MRFRPNGRGTGAWRCLVLILLSLSFAHYGGAHPTEDTENRVEPTENPEALPSESEGKPWWSAGGWLSFGGWSSSWSSAVSGTRSTFSWRFGNVPPENTEGGETSESPEGDRRCEELTLDTCRQFGYNTTSMPNLLNHESQDIARLELEQYNPLVQVNCSADMAFFLCALHAPRCTEGVGGGERLLPCRQMCERIKSRCNPLLQTYQYTWPSFFDCEKYPDQLQAHCTGQ